MLDVLLAIALLPLRTNRALRKVPYVTYSLLFLNILVYLGMRTLSSYDEYQVVTHWGFTINAPSFLTLISHAFIHGGLDHLVGNLLVLWIVGTILEAGIGSPLFALLYLAAMILAITLNGIIGMLFTPNDLGIPLIGASGAIAGVTGFAAFRYFHTKVLTLPLLIIVPIWRTIDIPLWCYAAFFGLKDVISGMLQLSHLDTSMTAHWAHIGGMGMGVLAAVLLNMRGEGQREHVLEESAKATGTGGAAGKGRSLYELENLLRDSPTDLDALDAKAGLLMAHGNREEGRALYLQAIPLFLQRGLPERAALAYLNVLRVFPDTVLALRDQVRMASVLETGSHAREAIQAFLLVARHYPRENDAQTALLRAAQIYQRDLKDVPNARHLLETLLSAYPGSPWQSLARKRLTELR